VCWWRLTPRWPSAQYPPTGQHEQVVRVRRAARLRQLVLAARGDARVHDYGYFHIASGMIRMRRAGAPRGHGLTPERAGGRVCCCGVGHWMSECSNRARPAPTPTLR
jgi:hypothetical protein